MRAGGAARAWRGPLSRLTVGGKLAAGFGSIAVLVIIVLAVAAWAVSQVSAAAQAGDREAAPKAQAAADVALAAKDLIATQTAYVLSGGRPADRQAFTDSELAFERVLAELRRVGGDPVERLVERKIADHFATFREIDALIWSSLGVGQRDRAARFARGPEVLTYNFIDADAKAFGLDAAHERAAAAARVTSARTLAAWVLVALALVVAALCVVLTITIARSIRHPLVAAQRVAERAAEGDLSVRVGSESPDETGRLSRALDEMIAGLSVLVVRIGAAATSLSASTQEMAATSEQAGSTMTEVAGAVATVAAGSDRQAGLIEAARRATGEIGAAVDSTAAATSQTADAAERARELARGGVDAAGQATDAMAAMRESTAEVTETIRSLGEKSQRIGGIVDTITGIAGQTNLLALNAAIEAARAGDQGRGFAVVADEVRQLAEESQRAAATISTLIDEIRVEMSRAVIAVEAGAQRTADGSEVVTRAREAFVEIGASVEDVTARVQQIAASSDQVVAVVGRVQQEMGAAVAVSRDAVAAFEHVNAGTAQTSVASQQIAASAQELAGLAGELQRAVAQFRT